MPSRVTPNVTLPASMEEHIRRSLTDILQDHAEQINHTAFEITTIATSTIVAHDLVLVDATSTGTVTVTLIPANQWRDKVMRIKLVSDAGIAIIVPQSGETVDGTATATIGTSLFSFQVVSDGNNWFIV